MQPILFKGFVTLLLVYVTASAPALENNDISRLSREQFVETPEFRLSPFAGFTREKMGKAMVEGDADDITGTSVLERTIFYLDWFNHVLRTYATVYKFDYRNFDGKITELRQDLSRIAFFIETESVDDSTVWKKLKFANSMYQVMVLCADKMKYYDGLQYSGALWVFKLLDLRVSSLAMFNSAGEPDPEAQWFDEKVLMLTHELRTLSQLASYDHGIPDGMRRLAKEQADEIDKVLNVLEKKVSKKTRY